MARSPVWRRLLDILALLACISAAAGAAFSAVDAQHLPIRIVSAAIAVALGVFVVRATPVFLRDWRSPSRSEG